MFRKYKLFFLLLVITSSYSQDEDLFRSLRSEIKIDNSLLPDKIIFSQRLLWGEKGLFRKTGWSLLNIKQREKELKIRRKMLKLHQLIGYATLAGMLAQGIIGTQLYNGNYKLDDIHETLGNLTSISYFTGAGLSLFAPPPLTNRKTKGLTSIKAHKYLATIHFSAMIATNVLSEENIKLHRTSAFIAFGSYATAVLVFKF
jgi:hypothetical protein